jgi:2-(1,2-epoxy-1,2-dihydrophenyl)acetyl-CoA isomerase
VELVTVERHERGIARVVMNHAAARNALGEDLRNALLPVFQELFDDAGTRVIVLASALKDFSVGGDLSRMDTLSDPKNGRRRIASAHKLARVLLAAEKPMIAEVRGHAVGAGAGLVLFCDTIVMGETASIGFPFPRVGLAPDFAIGYTLPKRIGLAKARQALLYSRSYKGAEALDIGLADDIVADDAVAETAMQRARELAAFPSLALSLTKRMLELSDDAFAVLDFEATAQPVCFASDDFQEGLAAFREKRKPNFDPAVQ